jgi:hypothetical protein
MRTSQMRRYGTLVGRTVTLLYRPESNTSKRYTAPIVWLRQTCKNKVEAQKIISDWVQAL